MIRRRALVRVAAACALTAPLAASAQPAARLPRVALVFFSVRLADLAGPDPVNAEALEFVHGLRDLGSSRAATSSSSAVRRKGSSNVCPS